MPERRRAGAYRSDRPSEPRASPLSAEVWFYEAFDAEEAHLRAFLPPGISAGFSRGTIAEAGHGLPPAPLISIRTQSRVPPDWEVKGLLTRSTGTDHVWGLPIPAIGHLPEYCSRAVAEQALMFLLALFRRLPEQVRHFETFDRDGLTGSEALGRTVAVFGVGHIGGEVAALCSAIGMTVVGVDPRPVPDVRLVTPEEALSMADAVVVAMDLNPTTLNYFTAERLGQLRPGAVFVNIARGEISLPGPLLEALESGRLSGVALDAHHGEAGLASALRDGSEVESLALQLARHPRVIATPHNAFNTAEALFRKAEQTVQQVVAFHENGVFLWSQ